MLNLGRLLVISAVFSRHQVSVEGRRTTNRLGCIVDQNVEAMVFLLNVSGKKFNAGNVTKVEPVNMQTVAPVGKVFFFGKANCGVGGETGCCNNGSYNFV